MKASRPVFRDDRDWARGALRGKRFFPSSAVFEQRPRWRIFVPQTSFFEEVKWKEKKQEDQIKSIIAEGEVL